MRCLLLLLLMEIVLLLLLLKSAQQHGTLLCKVSRVLRHSMMIRR
jgi:hypothetical protein